ncbi:MAG: hypothetical protein JSV91_11590 [Phycisphaerales bacterium]|nr:MAG: hypothetical protein JSV91_11590 [Phycisphaerales bacterium]
MKHLTLSIGCVAVLSAATFGSEPVRQISPAQAAERFLQENPQSRIYMTDGRPTRLYGKAFSHGSTPQASAEAFLAAQADVFGVSPDELAAVGPFVDGRHVQPIMYDRATDTYKFTGLYYTQVKNDIPVFRSRLTLLVRNEPDHPLVLASADLHDLRGFDARIGPRALQPEKGIANAMKFAPTLVEFTEPEMVIWAGLEGWEVRQPVLAYTFIGDSAGPVDNGEPDKFLFVTDAASGAILYQEDMILHVDVVGNAAGRATDGPGADVCHEEVPMPLKWARVSIGGTNAYTDENGDFVIPNAGSDPVDVTSTLLGTWFNVNNYYGSDASITLYGVVPPGPADFLHNADNVDEYYVSQVNGYVEANVVRDFVIKYNPAYPGLQQNEFPVNVNILGTCNAYYDYSSINFYRSGGGCVNSAFSQVVHHEYGHHLVAMAGSGQGQYGEGMSDSMATMITEEPRLALGFWYDCEEWMRTADNDFQYPCSGGIHYCGQLLSGCVWSTYLELLDDYPDDYLDILANLAVNAILLHTGELITPQITIDYLTLDDDDGNILNGTPHYYQINAGFSAHNMPGPELETGLRVTPLEGMDSVGPKGGPFIPESITYTLDNYEENPLDYEVSKTADWLDLSSTGGTIPIGGQVEVTVSINDSANVLPKGHYEDDVQFVNLTSHDGDTFREINLDVGVPAPVIIFDLDSSPGWSTQGEWAFGQPTGQGGYSWGYPDPTSGYTGDNVYGINLNGDYSTDVGGPYYLTTGAIDCSELTQISLHFRRWLNSDYQPYVAQTIEVSNNGTTWTEIWDNGDDEIAENSWSEQGYDIAAIADNQPTVYVRWGHQIGQSGAWAYSGWNIDDIQIWGVTPDEPCPGDVNGSGVVDIDDVFDVLTHWGEGAGQYDVNEDGIVDIDDIFAILAAWGPCP